MLTIVCANPACRQTKKLPAWMAKRQRFCSRSCGRAANRVPGIVICSRCGRRKAVRNRYQAKRQRFCSWRCAGYASPLAKTSKAQRQAWGRKGGAIVRAKALARWGSDELRKAFKRGYCSGYQAGIRYMQKWAS